MWRNSFVLVSFLTECKLDKPQINIWWGWLCCGRAFILIFHVRFLPHWTSEIMLTHFESFQYIIICNISTKFSRKCAFYISLLGYKKNLEIFWNIIYFLENEPKLRYLNKHLVQKNIFICGNTKFVFRYLNLEFFFENKCYSTKSQRFSLSFITASTFMLLPFFFYSFLTRMNAW